MRQKTSLQVQQTFDTMICPRNGAGACAVNNIPGSRSVSRSVSSILSATSLATSSQVMVEIFRLRAPPVFSWDNEAFLKSGMYGDIPSPGASAQMKRIFRVWLSRRKIQHTIFLNDTFQLAIPPQLLTPAVRIVLPLPRQFQLAWSRMRCQNPPQGDRLRRCPASCFERYFLSPSQTASTSLFAVWSLKRFT